MARYIKANPKVVQFLRLESDRNKIKDGNYLLWQADILPFGRLTELPQILEQIGGIALLAHEAREEQDGTVCRELPTATDPRFIVEKDAEPETPVKGETTEETEAVEGNQPGNETPVEAEGESENESTTGEAETV